MNSNRMGFAMLLGWSAVCMCGCAQASDWDEFKVKRAETFAFASKPALTTEGDRVEIRFAVQAACDVTVAVEHKSGHILRHLASGVLGDNAPAPFKKGSLEQTLVWDGKDDGGRYVDDKGSLSIRVSLGLKPRFERSLFFYPKRRSSRYPPLMVAAAEGVYVYDGGSAIDYLRLFSHKGDYLRTIYPFPADQLEKTKGLDWHTSRQDGVRFPVKGNFTQMSLLTSGENYVGNATYKPEKKHYRSVGIGAAHYGMEIGAASAMAVRNGRIALGQIYLNRLATDGTTGGLPLRGPEVSLKYKISKGHRRIHPRAAALSPDGKTLYVSGYVFASALGSASADIRTAAGWKAFNVVMKLDYEKGGAMEVFLGSDKLGEKGKGDAQLDFPTDVATDAQGRIYVADYLNHRVQVFTPDAKLVKSIPVKEPAQVLVHQKSGEIFVCSGNVGSKGKGKSSMTHFSALPKAKALGTFDLPFGARGHQSFRYGTTYYPFYVELDSFADKPTFWFVQDWAQSNKLTRKTARNSNIGMYRIEKNALVCVRDFLKELEKKDVRAKSHEHHRQRIYVNPASGNVYLTEGIPFVGKSFTETWVIDPTTGHFKREPLPFDAEDMCFDQQGHAYLRNIYLVARYDSKSWREIPWDYGEEKANVCTGSSSDRVTTSLVGGLILPSNGGWHHGGMHVSPKGSLLVACKLGVDNKPIGHVGQASVTGGKKWTPRLYPGRAMGGRGGGPFFHIWNQHGKLIHEDVVPGLADNSYGVGLDNEDNVYLMAAATRILDGKRYYNDVSGTLMKVQPGKVKIYSQTQGKVKLTDALKPDRHPDLVNSAQGTAWVEGAEWLYGGVGFGGKNPGVGCACMNARFSFDYFNRSFAPEIDRYRVAVLDGNGNLVLRIGQYGNVEDGMPLIKDGGPPSPRSIGGDEVALFHGAYLAVHTDKRLFIADPGNGRLVSVKLGYHEEAKVSLEGKSKGGR